MSYVSLLINSTLLQFPRIISQVLEAIGGTRPLFRGRWRQDPKLRQVWMLWHQLAVYYRRWWLCETSLSLTGGRRGEENALCYPGRGSFRSTGAATQQFWSHGPWKRLSIELGREPACMVTGIHQMLRNG